MHTTLNRIRQFDPREIDWQPLLAHLGKEQPDDEPLALTTVLAATGLKDALWCLRAVTGRGLQHTQRAIRCYALSQIRPLKPLLRDPRSLHALDVAERHTAYAVTGRELALAREAAYEAGWDRVQAGCGARQRRLAAVEPPEPQSLTLASEWASWAVAAAADHVCRLPWAINAAVNARVLSGAPRDASAAALAESRRQALGEAERELARMCRALERGLDPYAAGAALEGPANPAITASQDMPQEQAA